MANPSPEVLSAQPKTRSGPSLLVVLIVIGAILALVASIAVIRIATPSGSSPLPVPTPSPTSSPTPRPTPTPVTYKVPDVVGLGTSEATSVLAAAGYTLGDVGSQPSRGERDLVLSQSPKGGTETDPGIAVSLTVSSGARAPAPVIPDVAGLPRAEARQVLTAAGFAVEVQTRERGERGIALGTRPPAGDQAPPGLNGDPAGRLIQRAGAESDP